MSDRNADQVATRYITGDKRRSRAENSDWWSFLTVDQLWLWVIDEKTIVSCSTHRPDGLEDPVVEKIFDYLRVEKGKGKGQPPPSSVGEMSRFIVSFCISFINQGKWDIETKERSALQIFAETINEAAVKEASLFENFTNKVRRKREESEGTRQKSQEKPKESLDSNSAQQAPQKSLKDSLETEDWKSISSAADLLEEVKDIRDELKILKTLLAQQQTVWKGLCGHSMGTEGERGPIDTINEIDGMIDMSKATQDAVNNILSLEQNGINITEAVLSRKQGRTLMVFTIVTIIFLPLSFLASLFALNISIFQHDRQGNLSYQPGWIFPIILCISAGITGPLIASAFYVEKMTRMFKGLFGKERSSERMQTSSAPDKHAQTQRWGLKAIQTLPGFGILKGRRKQEGNRNQGSEKENGAVVIVNDRADTDENEAAGLDARMPRFFRRRRRPSLAGDSANKVGEKIV